MKKVLGALLVLSLITGCGLRAKQVAGIGLVAATVPAWYAIGGTSEASDIARAGLMTALLFGAAAMWELDAERDGYGEQYVLLGKWKDRPEVGDYVQEDCSPNVMVCTGPLRLHRVDAVRRVRHGWAVETTVVAVAPPGARILHTVLRSPAEEQVRRNVGLH